MISNEDFSIEQSEELIANLKSAKPSEFPQLHSALNLLGHVTQLPVTSMPPVLPSGFAQPVPLLPLKSTKPRRTIVTSVIVTGILASASLAAAAVTGIGPAPIVNMGHQTAKFVRGIAGAVSNVVTGGNAITTENFSPSPQIPGLTPAPTAGDEESPNKSSGDQSHSPEDLIPGLLNELTPQAKKSEDGKSSESDRSKNSHESQSPQSHESQSPQNEDSPSSSPIELSLSIIRPTATQEHTESLALKTPEPSSSPSSSGSGSDDE
jgi:hypothetical protein